MPNLLLTILGEDEVWLDRPHNVTHLISIRSPQHKLPVPGYQTVPSWLFLRFDDVVAAKVAAAELAGYAPPQEKHVRCILKFAAQIDRAIRSGRDVNLLSHCAMGISRSAAAAFIVLAALYGPSYEKHALADVLSARPIAEPNDRMVALADDQLRRGGAMVRALRDREWILTGVSRRDVFGTLFIP